LFIEGVNQLHLGDGEPVRSSHSIPITVVHVVGQEEAFLGDRVLESALDTVGHGFCFRMSTTVVRERQEERKRDLMIRERERERERERGRMEESHLSVVDLLLYCYYCYRPYYSTLVTY